MPRPVSLRRWVCACVAVLLFTGAAAFALLTPPAPTPDPLYADVPPALFGGYRRLMVNDATRAYYAGMTVAQPGGTERGALVSSRPCGAGQYAITLDARYMPGYVYRDVSASVYSSALAYEERTGVTLLWPLPEGALSQDTAPDANAPDGIPTYLKDENGRCMRYAPLSGGLLRRVRVFYADWYAFRTGAAPDFRLGTDGEGRDVAAGMAAALKTAAVYLACAFVVAVAAGWLYGRLFGRLKRGGVWLDGAAVLLSLIFAALCVRYLPARLGDTAALVGAVCGLVWLWPAVRCRRSGKKAVWRTACIGAVQALPAAVLVEAVLTGTGMLGAPGWGTLFAQGTGTALWLPAAGCVLLLAALVCLAATVRPTEKEKY